MSYFRRRKNRKGKEATEKPLDVCMVKNYYGCSYTVINGPVNIGKTNGVWGLILQALKGIADFFKPVQG